MDVAILFIYGRRTERVGKCLSIISKRAEFFLANCALDAIIINAFYHETDVLVQFPEFIRISDKTTLFKNLFGPKTKKSSMPSITVP